MKFKTLATVLILIGTNQLNIKLPEPEPKQVSVCKADNSSFKAWMDYRTITDTTSKQYEIVMNSEIDQNGLLVYNGKYVVALGSVYGTIGTEYRIELSGGQEIEVVKGDEKADEDTIDGCANPNGSMLEYIVDVNTLNESVKLTGDVNQIHAGFIKNIYKLEK